MAALTGPLRRVGVWTWPARGMKKEGRDEDVIASQYHWLYKRFRPILPHFTPHDRIGPRRNSYTQSIGDTGPSFLVDGSERIRAKISSHDSPRVHCVIDTSTVLTMANVSWQYTERGRLSKTIKQAIGSIPKAKAEEVVIRVKAAALNPVEEQM